MVRVIEDLAGDWRRLDERIDGLSGEIEAIAHGDAGCERLMSVPGIGPIISSAMVAAIGAARAGHRSWPRRRDLCRRVDHGDRQVGQRPHPRSAVQSPVRSEEHTSELQSRVDLVCRLLLEKKKRVMLLVLLFHKKKKNIIIYI